MSKQLPLFSTDGVNEPETDLGDVERMHDVQDYNWEPLEGGAKRLQGQFYSLIWYPKSATWLIVERHSGEFGSISGGPITDGVAELTRRDDLAKAAEPDGDDLIDRDDQ